MLLVTGYWLLVAGHWLLVAGYWLLVAARQGGKYFIIQVRIKKIAADYQLRATNYLLQSVRQYSSIGKY